MSFKREVLRRCGGRCEVVGCDADAETVHHYLKASTHPALKNNPDVGVGMCGPDHEELERRLRQGEDWRHMFSPAVHERVRLLLARYLAGQMGG